MAPEIRFTPFGIPYLVEFANVTFRSWASRMKHRLGGSSSPPPSPAVPAKSSNGGIYIHFPSRVRPSQKLSPHRLVRLKVTIAEAVQLAGMDMPKSEHNPAARAGGSLFKGTYGQVATALKAAGLNTTPCRESGFYEATRLGALFVVNHNAGNVELSKLTLWG